MKRLGVAVLTAALGCAQPGRPGADRPNVVLILTDDQRWDAMGCAGHPFVKTPNLDRLAREGGRFLNAFTTTSLCSPSRASILSGLYAHAHGVLNNFTELPPDLPTFPKRLREAGYETAWIGKWHMGEDNDEPRAGFDHWVSHKGQGTYYDTTFNINGARQTPKGYYSDRVTGQAIDWIRKPRSKPFCLVLGHKAPHSPNVPEEKYRGLYDAVPISYPESAFALQGKPRWIEERLTTWHGIYGPLWDHRKNFPDPSPEGVKAFGAFVRAYYATINSVDDSVGAVYEALRQAGRLDRTLFLFTTDNGFFLGEHGMMDKRAMHEPSIRVPLLVRYPALVRPGTQLQEMVIHPDLAPTVLEVCGARPLPKAHGTSWARLLRGDASAWRTSWHYAYDYEKQFPYTPNVRGVRTGGWKYMHYPHGDGKPDRHKAELYDLGADPQETRNVIDLQPGKAREMHAELHRLMEQTGALPDRMPLDEGVKSVLPDQKIR